MEIDTGVRGDFNGAQYPIPRNFRKNSREIYREGTPCTARCSSMFGRLRPEKSADFRPVPQSPEVESGLDGCTFSGKFAALSGIDAKVASPISHDIVSTQHAITMTTRHGPHQRLSLVQDANFGCYRAS